MYVPSSSRYAQGTYISKIQKKRGAFLRCFSLYLQKQIHPHKQQTRALCCCWEIEEEEEEEEEEELYAHTEE